MPYNPLPCSIHDHLELACIAGAELRIELHDGDVVEATPITTETRNDKTEWLLCRLIDNSPWEVRLDNIRSFEPTRRQDLFQRIELP